MRERGRALSYVKSEIESNETNGHERVSRQSEIYAYPILKMPSKCHWGGGRERKAKQTEAILGLPAMFTCVSNICIRVYRAVVNDGKNEVNKNNGRKRRPTMSNSWLIYSGRRVVY